MTKKASIADIPKIDLVFLTGGHRVSLDGGPATDLAKGSRHMVPAPQAKQFVDAGDAIAVEDIKWTPKSTPAEYLEATPGGKNAPIARVLTAHPALLPEMASTSAASSEPSDD